MLTWLHLSDFHVRLGDSYDRDVVLGALVTSVREFRDKGRSPDIVFATGDVAFSGKAGEYAAASAFFDELLEAVGLDRSRLFVIPGNHDVDRDATGYARTLASTEDAVKYFAPTSPLAHWGKQNAFLEWYREFFTGIREWPTNSSCGPVELVQVGALRVGVLPINSALFCEDDCDHAKLWVGRRSLDDALRTREMLDAQLRIALIHHPLEWLADPERTNVRAKLAGKVDVVLRGHLHETDVEEVISPRGRVVHIAAGAAYQTRVWPNRALYVTVLNSSLSVFPIRYEDSPTEIWTVDPSLFPGEPDHIGVVRLHELNALSPGAWPTAATPAPPPVVRSRYNAWVPARMQDVARALHLWDWVGGFERSRWQGYCMTVDDARRIIRKHLPRDEASEPAPDQLVPVIAQALESERALLEHVLDAGYDVNDDSRWLEILEAAAWQIITRYVLAVENGDWTSR